MRSLALAVALAAPLAASGHEVLHAVDRGRAVAVRALFADGRGLARARYQVFSPAEPGIPWQEGETDRDGWLAFVPDAPGRWRVKVVDASGHGLDVGVDVEASAARAAPSPGAAAAFLRPALGAVVAAAVFAALIAWRRRGAART